MNTDNIFIDYENILESVYPNEIYGRNDDIENEISNFRVDPNIMSNHVKTDNGSHEE